MKRMRHLKITKSITPRYSESFDKYLLEIWRIEMIDALEEIKLAHEIKWGNEQALKKLVNANLRFVVSVAKQYQHQWLSLPDIINEGNLWLIKAAKRFDETKGFKFISYAVWRIRQTILQALAEKGRIVRLPLNRIRQVNKIQKTSSKLEQILTRDPTDEEIAESLELSIDIVKDMQEYSWRALSLDKPISENDEATPMDLLKSEEHEASDYWLKIQSFKIEIARALSTLTPREAEIVKLYFWIDYPHPYTLEEIGEKLDVTSERVRQIKEKAVRTLKHTNKSKQLKQYLE